MSPDWWINFNHMEGLTDRCYRVTLSHESQSGDSLGEIGFSERKQEESGSQSEKQRSRCVMVFFFPLALLSSLDFGCFLFFQILLGVFIWLPTSSLQLVMWR